jgi:mRNA interferase YafQ
MRTIERSSLFKKDYKRLAGGRYCPALLDELPSVLTALVQDVKLESRHRDHDLTGDWRGYRECHVKADLLLIYSLPNANTLRLARLGTHSELFG